MVGLVPSFAIMMDRANKNRDAGQADTTDLQKGRAILPGLAEMRGRPMWLEIINPRAQRGPPEEVARLGD
jgi:hypothetical protein